MVRSIRHARAVVTCMKGSNRMLKRTLAGLSMILLATTPARGQSRDAARFRDSLRTISDVTALRRLERSLELPTVAHTVGPVLERGLIAQRLWEISSDREDARRARDAFQQAVRRFPEEPWAHYGLSLTLADGPEIRLTALGGVLSDVTIFQSVSEIFGKDPRSKARSAARKALDLKPDFGDAAILLSELALADGGRSMALVREARDALLETKAAGATSPSVTTALARMETALGNYSEAARVSEAAATAGDATALKARAQALFLQPGSETEGGQLYARALESLTAEAADAMYADVQVLLSPIDVAEWKRSTTDVQKRAWIERFWERRAADAGVTVAERLATHYRRLALASQRFVRNSARGALGAGALTTDVPAGNYPFDPRGAMLVRHGPPDAVISTKANGVLPNETWIYSLPDSEGNQLFHFVAGRGEQDYTLVGDIMRLIDPQVLNDGFNVTTRNSALLALLQDRTAYEPKYQVAVTRITTVLRKTPNLRIDAAEIRTVLASSEAAYRRDARAAITTDSYRREYEGDIAFLHDVFTLRSEFSRTELTAALALPAADIEPLAGGGGVYALNLSVILIDTLQGTVTRRDTAVEVDAGRKLAPGDYVRTHVTVPVVPSEHTIYKLVVEDRVSGRGMMDEGSRRLRDYGSSERLLISDIVLALPDSAGDWRRGAQRLALALPRSFEPARPFTVFYEVYNFAQGEAYSTRIVVTPLDGKGGIRGLLGGKAQPIEVKFDAVAQPDADGVLQELRQVAPDLGPGRYRMTIEVTANGSRRTAVTETQFTVTQ